MARLDVSAPGDAWSDHAWRSLAMCMHAVCGLEELHVRLPAKSARSVAVKRKVPDSFRGVVNVFDELSNAGLCVGSGDVSATWASGHSRPSQPDPIRTMRMFVNPLHGGGRGHPGETCSPINLSPAEPLTCDCTHCQPCL